MESTYHSFSFPHGTRGVSETTMSVRGDRVWLGGAGGVQLFTRGRFYLMRWKDPSLPVEQACALLPGATLVSFDPPEPPPPGSEQ